MLHINSSAVPSKCSKKVTLDEIVALLEQAHKSKKARCYIADNKALGNIKKVADGKNQIYIAAIHKSNDKKTVTFLINRGNPDIALPAFVEPSQNAVQILQPTSGQAPGTSAHLVVSTKDSGQGHRACIEQMPSLSMTLVFDALNKMLENITDGDAKYKYDAEIKKEGKTIVESRPYRPSLNLTRVPSEKLHQDLSQGELTQLVLTREIKKYTGPGAANIIKKVQEKVVLNTKRVNAKSPDVSSFIEEIVEWGKQKKYTGVTFHIDNLPGGMSTHPTLPLADQDALEQLYVRAQRITSFKNVLMSCYEKVYGEIETKMIDLLEDDSLWNSGEA